MAMVKTLKIIAASLFIFVTCDLLLVTGGSVLASEYVRIAIAQNADSLNIKVQGPYEIIDLNTNKGLYHGRNLTTTVASYKSGILIGKVNAKSDKVLLKTGLDNVVIVNGRRFRGGIQFLKQASSRLLVINQVDLEDYVQGILYHETSHYWPMEVLKAQAVCCRTYALYQKEGAKLKDYDLTSDIYSQVYGGQTSERYRITKAVQATKGIVLAFNGKIIPAFYHATCAGHTEDAALLWNINIAPLKGVACNYCKESPHFNWHYVFSFDELKEKLVPAGYKIGAIKDINILGRDASGRVTDLTIESSTGQQKISAKDFREALSPNLIRSTNFNVNIAGSDAVFEGIGWGHGVGLCQWGAYFMAKDGSTYQEILKFYYPGVKINRQ